MSVLSGPEIKRLATRCPIADVQRGEWVYLDGHPAQVLISPADMYEGETLLSVYGRQVWERIDPATLLTRCREDGGRLTITPFDAKFCGPNSYDVHLGDSVSWYVNEYGQALTANDFFDPLHPPKTASLTISPNGEVLRPGVLYLASTLEYTETFGLVPKLEGRSSIARGGLKVHLTAGFGDDGFRGHWTLELECTHRYRIQAGMKIAQLCYTTLTGERDEYRGRYSQQGPEPVASRFHWTEEEVKHGRS